MRISSVTSRHYRIPLPVTLSDSTHGDITHFGLITAEVTTDEGAEGLGYTYTVGDIGGAAVHSLVSLDLAPSLAGQPALDTEALWHRMWWQLHFVGRGGLASFAIAAVDVALWDLKSRQAGLPLWRMLGGSDPTVTAYAGGIDLQFTTDALLAQADGFLASGFRAIKMKVGRDRLSEDVERVEAMRAKLGPDFALLADANMRWSVEAAVRAARALAPSGLVWLEEPTIPDDVAGHRRIRDLGGVPIASGENLHSLHEFQRLIEAGGADYPEPDAATLGGVTPWIKVAHLAESFGLPVTSHGVHDLHVHLLAAVPNASYLEFHGFGLERYVESPLTLEAGRATAPDRPGHGVRFDWDGLEAHRVA